MKLEKLFDKILNILHIKVENKTKKLLLQIFKFAIVGGIAFVVDYLILILCVEVFKIPVLISSIIAFSISVLVNYYLSVLYVFEIKNKNSKRKNFIVFIIFSVIGLLLTELIMWLGTDILKISYLIVKIVSTIVVMVFNFITRKIFLEGRGKESSN